MDPLQFLTASRVVIVAGKGGVGKTTVTAAAAIALARTGRRVLAVEVDGTRALGRLLTDSTGSLGLTNPPPFDSGEIRVESMDPEQALVKHLTDRGMGRLSSRLAKSGMLTLVATAIPGIRDLVILGRLRQLADQDDGDVLLVDAPAAGHALTFLSTPTDIVMTATSGPIRQQADSAKAFISDPAQVSVLLVTTPQATPVTETVETAYAIEEDLDLTLGPVIVNSIESDFARLPAPTAAQAEAEEFLSRRIASERGHLDRLASQLALPRIELPRLDVAPTQINELLRLADVIGSGPR